MQEGHRKFYISKPTVRRFGAIAVEKCTGLEVNQLISVRGAKSVWKKVIANFIFSILPLVVLCNGRDKVLGRIALELRIHWTLFKGLFCLRFLGFRIGIIEKILWAHAIESQVCIDSLGISRKPEPNTSFVRVLRSRSQF